MSQFASYSPGLMLIGFYIHVYTYAHVYTCMYADNTIYVCYVTYDSSLALVLCKSDVAFSNF